MSFIKRSEGKITSIIDSIELDEKQKASVKKLSNQDALKDSSNASKNNSGSNDDGV